MVKVRIYIPIVRSKNRYCYCSLRVLFKIKEKRSLIFIIENKKSNSMSNSYSKILIFI